MNTERKVCVRCLRTGHRSHACKLPILQPQKSENPELRQQNGVSINAGKARKAA